MHHPDYFAAHRRTAPWLWRATWPFDWIAAPGVPPQVVAYRLDVELADPVDADVWVTADQRYELWIDGVLYRRGPEIGTPRHWYADRVPVRLTPGLHRLEALVWTVAQADGDYATASITHGFALGVDGPANESLATGRAPWQHRVLTGITFAKDDLAYWTVPGSRLDARLIPWDAMPGSDQVTDDAWLKTPVLSKVHAGRPIEGFPDRLVECGMLPPAWEQPWTTLVVRHVGTFVVTTGSPFGPSVPLGPHDPQAADRWRDFLQGASLHIPVGRAERVVLDLGSYAACWAEVTIAGDGGTCRLSWMEALGETPVLKHDFTKGHRDHVGPGHYAAGLGDTFVAAGVPRTLRAPYWRCGRYLVIETITADQPLTLQGLRLTETRHPLEREGFLKLESEKGDGAAIDRVLRLCERTLQVTAQDQYADGVYHERMAYLGDAVIDHLGSYVLQRDASLARKALRQFASQQLPDGLIAGRAPTRNLLIIPLYALWFPALVEAHLMWRGDRDLVRELMPVIRGILDCALRHRLEDGTLGAIEGWNFLDWAAGWADGEPPDAAVGGAAMQFQTLLALAAAERLEAALDEPELAARWRRHGAGLATATHQVFWQPARNAFADDRAGRFFSQHIQVLAHACGDLPVPDRAAALHTALTDPALTQTTIYFRHHLFSACAEAGLGDVILDGLGWWAALPDRGFTALPEQPEPSRSDCHAWGSHPLYHATAALLGVQPAAPGFQRVRIAPVPSRLTTFHGEVPHPNGTIKVQLQRHENRLVGTIACPVPAEVRWGGSLLELGPGEHRIDL